MISALRDRANPESDGSLSSGVSEIRVEHIGARPEHTWSHGSTEQGGSSSGPEVPGPSSEGNDSESMLRAAQRAPGSREAHSRRCPGAPKGQLAQPEF
eukprot:12728067-Alexandrium_andersonii.AAC.1